MNAEDLKRVADEEGILPSAYSLGRDYHEDQLVLTKEGVSWHVFYYERGIRWSERSFRTEDEACKYLLEVLRKTPSARRKK